MEEIEIERINTYDDNRFPPEVLLQHGAFVVNGNLPYGVEIIDECSAVVHGEYPEYYAQVIEEFRFYAEHITRFYDEKRNLLREYDGVHTFWVDFREIQPSQFFVDREKEEAVASFVQKEEDIILPLIRYDGRYVSLDGHTRMAVGIRKGFTKGKGFLTQCGEYIYGFVDEARKREITSPYDMEELSHEEYEIRWNRYCEEYFQEKEKQEGKLTEEA